MLVIQMILNIEKRIITKEKQDLIKPSNRLILHISKGLSPVKKQLKEKSTLKQAVGENY